MLPGDCPQPGLPVEAGGQHLALPEVFIGYKGLRGLLCSWLAPSALLRTGPPLPAGGSVFLSGVPVDHCGGSDWLSAGSSLAMLGSTSSGPTEG